MDQLYFVVHTHWDREWYQPFQRMRARLVAMTERMLGLVESGQIPFFHFDGQTIVLEDYLEIRPRDAARIAKLVRAGKVQIGPWYVLADSFLVSGEALIRNLEIGSRLARRFGEPLDLGYLPDQFGHIAQMPQILSGFGLKAAVVWRGVGREIDRNRFIWQALDGSEVLAAYLPFGYSNGANFPTDSVEATVARAREIAEKERDFAAGAPILVMNGTDHAAPDPLVPRRLQEARERAPFGFEIGTLEAYVKRLLDLPLDGVPRHRGELRSPARAHLLPGVTSARAWIKQRDFANCYLLERLADPLAALSRICGGEALQDYLDLAWRFELQNHPHDSICGCSVDQVHEDMRHRFDQAAMIGEMVVREAARAILHDGGDARAGIAVFNPTFARRALVSGEVEVEDPDAAYVVTDAKGRRIPVAIETARRARTFETELEAPALKQMVAGISGAQLMGRFVNRFELRRGEHARFELDLYVSRSPLSALDVEGFKRRIATELPDDARVRIRSIGAVRATIGFFADDLAQAGFSFYRLIREAAMPKPAESLPLQGQTIENDFYRVSAAARGLVVDDLRTGRRLELGFEDDGDRGDEYNFDPVPGAPTIAEPVSADARVLERGPVRSRLGLSLLYRLPAALTPERRARTTETVDLPVELVATLYAGLERVDFEAALDNRVRDHRLRAALSTPIDAAEAVSDTSFGIVRRSLAMVEPPGAEDICPTAPHRTMTAVESDEFSAALVSRGLYEVEVRRDRGGASILLTLLRCVGWLSRSDLSTRRGGAGPQMETPGAQEPGAHRFEFALATWRGADARADLLQRCHAYAFPPRLFNAVPKSDAAPPALCECDNPRVVFSTARSVGKGRDYLVRVFSVSDEPERAGFRVGRGRLAGLVDLAGRALDGAAGGRRGERATELALRPFQIATLAVRVAGVQKKLPRRRQNV